MQAICFKASLEPYKICAAIRLSSALSEVGEPWHIHCQKWVCNILHTWHIGSAIYEDMCVFV